MTEDFLIQKASVITSGKAFASFNPIKILETSFRNSIISLSKGFLANARGILEIVSAFPTR
jgi:hypothetical protein